MTFRLLLVLIVSVGAGAVIGLLPARLPETMTRLAAGLGLAIAVAAAVAAWSLAEERVSGRAGWLVTRSVARSTYLAGWYFALVLVPAIGLAVGALLGWLAIPGGAATVPPGEYLAVILAVATTLGAAVAHRPPGGGDRAAASRDDRHARRLRRRRGPDGRGAGARGVAAGRIAAPPRSRRRIGPGHGRRAARRGHRPGARPPSSWWHAGSRSSAPTFEDPSRGGLGGAGLRQPRRPARRRGAHGRGHRPAVDRGRLRGLGRTSGASAGSSTRTCWRTSSRCRSRVAGPTCGERCASTSWRCCSSSSARLARASRAWPARRMG